MAEVTAFRNNALPYPVYGVPYVIEFPILDADGAGIASATGLDSEIVKNGDALTDCTNEATEIGGGWYYLLLTATEMTADSVSIEVRSSSTGAQTVRMKLAPRKLVSLRTGTSQGGAAGYITLDASAGAKDDIWNGCLCVATIDSNVEARVISDYTGSNQRAAVSPSWNVVPDADDTFIVYLPEGRQIAEANVTAVNSEAATGVSSIDSNVISISGDTTAANNLEAACDGTGYNIGGGSVVAASVTGEIGSLSTQAKADVNAQVLDVLATDTFSELAAIPAATSSLKDKLTWVFMLCRNRITQTATTKILKADDTTTTVATFTESDDGTTYVSGEGA